ncbi:MAG: sugar transferase [Actinomycetota bacterium]|nr:sugar transferase [Actinomycetota bacterium]
MFDLGSRADHWREKGLGLDVSTGRTIGSQEDPEPTPEHRAPTRMQYRRLAVEMAFTDAIAVLAGFSAGYVLRFGYSKPPFDKVLVTAFAPVLWIGLLAVSRTYDVFRLPPAEQFRRLFTSTTLGITLVVMLSFWSHGSFSRLWIGLAWILTLSLLLLSRHIWNRWLAHRRSRGDFTFRTLILGTNEEGIRLAQGLSTGNHGFLPLGFISTGRGGLVGDGLPVVGSLSDVRDAVRRAEAECMFVASSSLTWDEMQRVMKEMRQERVEVRVSANLPETLSKRIAAQTLGSVTTLSLRPVQLTGPQAAVKRTLDIVGSVVTIIVLSPLFLAIAMAIKLTSRGPVLFTQMRTGRRGERIALMKFRTMVKGAEEMRDNILDLNQASGPLFKVREDPRVTRVGGFLRRWSLDELPQLMNVLMGDMSLVGPRPSLPEEVDHYEDWQRDRLEVAPGITGLWQVSGRSDVNFDDYVRLDLFYIENWSVAYDLYILAKTIPAVLSRKGSY